MKCGIEPPHREGKTLLWILGRCCGCYTRSSHTPESFAAAPSSVRRLPNKPGLRCVHQDIAPWWKKAMHEPELAYRAKSASPSPLFPSCILRALKYLTEWFRHQPPERFRHQPPAGLHNSVSVGTSVPRTGFQSAIITAFYQNMTAALKHFTVKLYNSKPCALTGSICLRGVGKKKGIS